MLKTFTATSSPDFWERRKRRKRKWSVTLPVPRTTTLAPALLPQPALDANCAHNRACILSRLPQPLLSALQKPEILLSSVCFLPLKPMCSVGACLCCCHRPPPALCRTGLFPKHPPSPEPCRGSLLNKLQRPVGLKVSVPALASVCMMYANRHGWGFQNLWAFPRAGPTSMQGAPAL